MFAPVLAQSQDTVWHHTLSTIDISVQSAPSETRTSAPTQVITLEKIQNEGLSQISDAVKELSGVTLKDYGGLGGVKTISSRGLGSQFSTLTIDGIPVNDAQNGQVDLGRYLLGNCAFVTFLNGHDDQILQSAKSLAAGSTLNLTTAMPRFGFRNNLFNFSYEGGSFGFCSPSFSWQHRLTPRWYTSLWTSYMKSDGDYPFILYYTLGRQDSSSREIRQNSQMQMFTLDADLGYTDSLQSLAVKLHYINAFHALPGAVTFYTVKASEHTEEHLGFLQARYQRKLSDRLDGLILAKYQNSGDLYEDTMAQNASHLIHNEYHQQEAYLSTALRYHASQHLQFALASDQIYNTLLSNLSLNNNVHRFSNISALTAFYQTSRLTLNCNLLNTLILDTSQHYQKLSPYASLSFQVCPGLRLRYFFKDSYRVPNFNEMYYFSMPRDLRPEHARQNNLGLTYSHGSDSSWLSYLSLTLDCYANHITDKLIAIPTQNMFLWSMQNIGIVNILGLDLSSTAQLRITTQTTLGIEASYTFQHALDLTSPDLKTYRSQIPYTPRHSGNLSLILEHPFATLAYSLMVVGDRYSQPQNSPQCLVKGFADHSITLSKSISTPIGKLLLQFRILNLLNAQYEVIRNYPMMGRNYRIKISLNL